MEAAITVNNLIDKMIFCQTQCFTDADLAEVLGRSAKITAMLIRSKQKHSTFICPVCRKKSLISLNENKAESMCTSGCFSIISRL